MELVLLGTGAGHPGPRRGASCVALRRGGRAVLFDAGEGAQVQLARAAGLRPGQVEAVFVTHLHGDHVFGLPGLLCALAAGPAGEAAADPRPPVQVFGPEGLRLFLRLALRVTRSAPRNYVCHELVGVPHLHAAADPAPPGEAPLPGGLRAEPLFGEVAEGRDIRPRAGEDGALVWDLDCSGLAIGLESVQAAPLAHRVPCVGYVVEEPAKPGALDAAAATRALEAHAVALAASGCVVVGADGTVGERVPPEVGGKALLGRVKGLGEGQSLQMPDGTRLQKEDFVKEGVRGRKVAILGDCSDSGQIHRLAEGADVLVHEATHGWLPGDKRLAEEVARDVVDKGHSTPAMAGEAARACKCGALVLHHFSQRYKPQGSGEEAAAVMDAIRAAAVATSGLDPERVTCGQDFDVIPVR